MTPDGDQLTADSRSQPLYTARVTDEPTGGELRALRDGCVVWIDADSDLIEMTGEDRHRFLNGLITADVLELPAGESRYGLFTDIKGRILADVLVVVFADRLRLRLPPGSGAPLAEHMSRYIVTDRVELEELDADSPLMLGGPGAAAALRRWSGDVAPPESAGWHAERLLLDCEATVLREPRGPSAFSIWPSSTPSEALLERMLGSPEPPLRVGAGTVERARVEAGIPRFGVDFDQGTFPQEADLDSAVSYEKGCYLGQEVVARIHFRGGVNRVLRGLEIEGDAAAAPGQRLVDSGSEVGTVTSTAGHGSPRALGLVAVAAAEPGRRLELENGAPVRLVALPFEGA